MKKVRVELFATNLRTPSHMEWTKDGRLLVSEHTAGTIKDITNGGDFKDVEPFAYDLKGPTSILPVSVDRIYVSEMWGNRIAEISKGGKVDPSSALTNKINQPYSLSQVNNRIYAVEKVNFCTNRIVDVTEGIKEVYLSNIATVALQGLEGLIPLSYWENNRWQEVFMGCDTWQTAVLIDDEQFLLVSNSSLGQLLKVPSQGGDYLQLVQDGYLVATGLSRMGGMIQHPKNKLVYVTQPLKGTVMAIDPSTTYDYRFEPPVVQGLNTPTCVRFSPDGEEMYVCSMPTGTVWRITNF